MKQDIEQMVQRKSGSPAGELSLGCHGRKIKDKTEQKTDQAAGERGDSGTGEDG